VVHGGFLRRREFITLLGGAAVVWPLVARAQQSSSKIPVVGVLWHAGSAEEEEVYLSVLVKAFNDLGYIEGKNIHLDHRFPAENLERFRELARELVGQECGGDHAAALKNSSRPPGVSQTKNPGQQETDRGK
jgi:putative ABC transport system substrate-binding protein